MALFGSRRRRASRVVPLRRDATLRGWIAENLRNRTVTVRLLVCAVTIAALAVAVEGWKPPFPYRLSDVAVHGISARTDFQLVQSVLTDQARAEAEQQAPYVFVHDPEPLRLLPARLRSDLGQVAQAKSLEELSAETRAAFGFTPPTDAGENQKEIAANLNQEFITLKANIGMEDGTVGNRIDDVVAEFELFIAPLKKHGVVRADDLATNDIRPGRVIAIVPVDGGVKEEVVSLAEVQLSEVLKDTGPVGKAWPQYPDLQTNRNAMQRWLLSQSPVTLRYDSVATQKARREARNRVPDVTVSIARNDPLVAPRELIDDERRAVLWTEYQAYVKRMGVGRQLLHLLTAVTLLTLLAVLVGHYLIHEQPQIVQSLSKLCVFLGSIVASVAMARLLSYDPWRAEIVPITVAVMVMAVAYDQELAILTAFVLALVVAFSTSGSLGQFAVLLSVAVASVLPLASVPSRSTLIKIGFWSAGACFLVTWGSGLLLGQSYTGDIEDPTLFMKSLWGAVCCLGAGYLVAGSLPFIESWFGVVTNISLLEMSDVSHPLLQELVRRAPGTYNHSISVATLGETAAESIGANGLLVRVGAYYHDIGKMLKPHYFVENVVDGSGSRHENLAPAMSTLIIIGHVKDGVDLARQHNIPQAIVDFIEQHHGTTLVEYFYHEAARLAEEQPQWRTTVEESAFRYPGPKPQTREAGVMMLADAVESASRTLSDPTPKRIETLVHELTMKRLLDGQFDECSLTLSEIQQVEDSLVKSLIGIYHGRVKYPEQRTA